MGWGGRRDPGENRSDNFDKTHAHIVNLLYRIDEFQWGKHKCISLYAFIINTREHVVVPLGIFPIYSMNG